MIFYNMCYRGPFEYDKFCLNILQFYNEVQLLTHQEFTEQNNSILELNNKLEQLLLDYEKYIDEKYDILIRLKNRQVE